MYNKEVEFDNIAMSTLEDVNKAEAEANGTFVPITKEQADFINDFKRKYKIDSNEKFEKYIAEWDKTGKIKTKRDLINSGKQGLQKFIDWINSKTKKKEFLIPSSDQTQIVW